ncbi:MAG TPA: hypothetical protein VIU45_06535 [Chitinophagaceae bacterium]
MRNGWHEDKLTTGNTDRNNPAKYRKFDASMIVAASTMVAASFFGKSHALCTWQERIMILQEAESGKQEEIP